MSNKLSLVGLDHLEFTCDTLQTPTRSLFYRLGFSKVAEKDHQELLGQGQIRFLLKADPEGHSREYFNKHGEGVSKISFHVKNLEESLETVLKRGAKLVEDFQQKETEHGLVKTAAIQGVGDILNELVERPQSVFRPQFEKVSTDHQATPLTTRVSRIDHLTNNVPYGELDHWVNFYETIFGFKVTRTFNIKGEKTGLYSKVIQSEDNQVIIPVNEPATANSKSQIQEFLELHKGAGVQHIALMTPDIISTVNELWQRDLKFLDIPATYYEDIPNRPFTITENIPTLEKNQILVDGDPEGYLLQIFSQTYIGPLFFEFIQRKNHWGFGEGNFQALFDAIERDQMQRGYL